MYNGNTRVTLKNLIFKETLTRGLLVKVGLHWQTEQLSGWAICCLSRNSMRNLDIIISNKLNNHENVNQMRPYIQCLTLHNNYITEKYIYYLYF